MEASGGDGDFSNGNEIPVTPAGVAASGNTIEVGLAGVQPMDDIYRVQVSDAVVDLSGIPLDGFYNVPYWKIRDYSSLFE